MPQKNENTKILDEILFVKYFSNEIRLEEKIEVESWLAASLENQKTFALLEEIHYAQKAQQRLLSRDSDLAFEVVQKKISEKKRRLLLQRVAVAASIFILLFSIGSQLIRKEGPLAASPTLVTVTAFDNSLTKIALPDGTEVFLNKGSSIVYPSSFSGKERNVKLNGEAFFKVAHNPDQPFVLSNKDGQYNIKVLGTEFNVQAYEGEEFIEATLVSGSIELDIPAIKSVKVLTPSQMASFSLSTNELQIAKVNTDRTVDWMYNRLVFRDTPMIDVLTKLSKFYNVDFKVDNKVINTYIFTGTFEDKPLSQVLDYMKIASNLNYKITSTGEHGEKTIINLYN